MLRDLKESWFQHTDIVVKRGGVIEDIIDTLKSTDLSQYADIIVHIGTNDVASSSDTTSIRSSIEKLITLVMVEAPTTKLHISALCPRKTHMEGITEANSIIRDTAQSLDCSFINVNPKCMYQDGSVDDTILCDGLHLSEKGTNLLIECFVNGVESLNLTKEFTKNKSPDVRKENNHLTKQKYQHHGNNRENRNQRHRPASEHHQPSKKENRKRTACRNCGLSNHDTSECYHESPIRCRTCHRLGHKDRFCKYYYYYNEYGNYNANYDDSYNHYGSHESQYLSQTHCVY